MSNLLGQKTNNTKTYLWMSDIHLNFLQDDHIQRWAAYAARSDPNVSGVFITGDISEAPHLGRHLLLLQQSLDRLPIWYVHGNHDYWRSSVSDVHDSARRLKQLNSKITWLGDSPVVQLNEKVGLVGHDGWYDAMAGDWKHSHFRMRDWDLIADFQPEMFNTAGIVSISRKLAGQAIVYLENKISEACVSNDTIVIMTHFPPFEDAAKYRGRKSDSYALPWYTCASLGTMILEKSQQHPDKKFIVLCGHTHEKCIYNVANNLIVYVQGAAYGNPGFMTLHLG